MKYQVGDKVVIQKSSYAWNLAGHMNKYIGQVLTIRSIKDGWYKMEEDYDDRNAWKTNGEAGWDWNDDMISHRVDDDKELNDPKEDSDLNAFLDAFHI